LSDRVAEDILETIVARGLKPGDALPAERELGEQFGVSRTVIREAVRALDARGLLEVRVGSRIRVAAVDPQIVRDTVWHFARTTPVGADSIAVIRDALDGAAARAAAEHATQQDIDQIGRAIADLERGDPGEAEAGFRRAVLLASHNELLIVLAEAVADLAAQRPAAHPNSERLRAVVSAIAMRDADGAERAMRGESGWQGGSGNARG
jgi:GntR family transcriptional regulator, transcriptional repressor for pyruvate dehydrogenase complex